MAKPKPKLPKVWVLLLQDGDFLGYVCKTKEEARVLFDKGDRMAEYAPVQPPRRCVWVNGKVGCQTGTYAEKHKSIVYCPYCGGKIKVKS